MMTKNILLKCIRWIERFCMILPTLGSFRPLRGWFRAINLLEQGKLQGDILAKKQEPGPTPAESVTIRSGLNQHDFQPWPVFWVRSDDARLVGRMLHWRDRKDRACSEGVFHLHERRRLGEDRALAQILVPKPRMLEGAWTSIASNWGDGLNYYHWMTDSLTRLMIRERLPEITRILIPRSGFAFITESLELLGLRELAMAVDNPCIQPERFYFCSPTAMTGTWNPLGFDWLRKKFSPYFRCVHEGLPVFLTRRKISRVPDEIEALEEIFRSNGFQIVDCGTISLKDQLALTSSASAIAGLHGAAMTNLLWSRPGTPVLELFQSSYLNACYEQICFEGGLDYSYLILGQCGFLDGITAWINAEVRERSASLIC